MSANRPIPRGTDRHQAAVTRLMDSYRALPAGAPVRLAKRTSNLFRPREAASAGLDVTGLDGVIDLDASTGTADVQGMCTYEDLVAATLPHGLMPTVVPQLRTITLGGAVTGLGIESTSFRSGLPHEGVLEMDVLTGDGELVTAAPHGDHEDLFRGFPNSYGTLGYAVRLRVGLERVRPFVALRNVRFADLSELTDAVRRVVAEGAWEGEPVDLLDGVVFSARESYLVMGRWSEREACTSDYTGQGIYYLSLRARERDALTTHDYLWRWDTDWFWCSKTFGAQNPWVRRVWPARYRRSDVYHRLVRLENRHGVVARVDSLRGRPPRERVIQDVEIPLDRTADFLTWFLAEVPMTPVWLCPLRLRDEGGPLGHLAPGERPWSLYPLVAGTTYVNAGFWGTVPIPPGAFDGDVNRRVEHQVAAHDGHKSLYSDAYYDEDRFWTLYGGDVYPGLRRRYDPEHRLLDLYAKTVGRR